MGEEKKEAEDTKKLKYEVPQLVKLNGNTGAGPTTPCTTGSGDETCVSNGNAATTLCNTGNSVLVPP